MALFGTLVSRATDHTGTRDVEGLVANIKDDK
jgi:hypothetical protein